jgi:hypothetical protein
MPVRVDGQNDFRIFVVTRMISHWFQTSTQSFTAIIDFDDQLAHRRESQR